MQYKFEEHLSLIYINIHIQFLLLKNLAINYDDINLDHY